MTTIIFLGLSGVALFLLAVFRWSATASYPCSVGFFSTPFQVGPACFIVGIWLVWFALGGLRRFWTASSRTGYRRAHYWTHVICDSVLLLFVLLPTILTLAEGFVSPQNLRGCWRAWPFVAGALLLVMVIAAFRPSMRYCNQRRALAKKGARLCEQCGYDLQCAADNRCPECGHPFDIVVLQP